MTIEKTSSTENSKVVYIAAMDEGDGQLALITLNVDDILREMNRVAGQWKQLRDEEGKELVSHHYRDTTSVAFVPSPLGLPVPENVWGLLETEDDGVLFEKKPDWWDEAAGKAALLARGDRVVERDAVWWTAQGEEYRGRFETPRVRLASLLKLPYAGRANETTTKE